VSLDEANTFVVRRVQTVEEIVGCLADSGGVRCTILVEEIECGIEGHVRYAELWLFPPQVIHVA
jgi:hypothetical protein